MAKISLCLIVGNVEEYIERCITSFLPIAHEVCIVRAIGNQKPDRTLALAEACCRTRAEFRLAEYHNKPEHADWPHVDDFAAARQQSFDLASGDYCFWVDSDDVLEAGAALIHKHADRGGYAAFIYPYRILGRGYMVPRERMMLRDAGRWEYPIHEHYRFHIEPVSAIEDQRVIVKHMPHLNKTGSSERNLRILESMDEDTLPTGLLYHKHVELAIKHDIPGSVRVAEKVLARKDLGKAEKYGLFLDLAQAATDSRTKAELLHQAYAADPRRREALGLLAVHSLDYAHWEEGLAYAQAMMALPHPANPEWNDRAPIYGFVGDDIYAQALRMNGRAVEAEELRQKRIKISGAPRIALLHATRGRCELAAGTRKLWIDTANRPELIEHIFVFDADDKDSAPLSRLHHIALPPGGGCVAAWNYGALATTAKVLVSLSDDWTPFPGWDDAILERIVDVNKPVVLAVNDGIRTDKLMCIAICTREYFMQDWFLFHPGFTGVFSDNWFTEVAYSRNQVIEAKDLTFIHEHPVKTGKAFDDTYQAQNAPERYHAGKAVLERLRAGKDWCSIGGFFDYWAFYELIARGLKNGDSVVEVGVWLGRSIVFLAQTLKAQGKRVKIYAVDHFKGESNQKEHEETVHRAGGNLRATFESNIARCEVADMIEILDGDSAEMAKAVPDGSLAFCFIDAAHDYESVKRDILAWRPKLKTNGILAGHDAQWPAVDRAVKELLQQPLNMASVWMEKPCSQS